ncbi:MAG TPA: hypothetical protein VNX26_10715 [Candidatus Acidoferrum sp.]|jgi:hypothetical protein|nr:hypothetical protein [Candidatus Acidoferrum sp.]
MPCHPNVKICTHVKATGHPCGSPALSGERFCYFHQRMIRGVPTPPKSRIHPMALLENEEGIQVALMETLNAIVRNTIDLKRASLILRALSIATHNARRVRFDRVESEMVRAIPDYPPAPAQAASVQVKEEREEAIGGVAQQSLPRAEPRGQSLAPHVSAGKALADGKSPEEPALSERSAPKGTAEAALQTKVPRKPPGRVTSAPIAQALAVNARPQRE